MIRRSNTGCNSHIERAIKARNAVRAFSHVQWLGLVMPPIRFSTTLRESGLERFSRNFETWADGISILLLAIAYAALDLSPKRYLWFSVRRFLLQVAVLVTLTFWSTFRFITEGIYDTAGPREFWAVTVVYISRWLWLAAEGIRPGRGRKWLKAVRELKTLKRLRLGESTSAKREGDTEIVIRKAVKKVSRRYRTKENSYWRGYEVKVESVQVGCKTGVRWLVHLNDENHLLEDLEALLNGSQWDDNTGNAKGALHKGVYDVVLASFPRNLKDAVDDAWCEPFKSRWKPLPREYLARQVGALDESLTDQIARRVAADAVYYVFHEDGEYRLPAQIGKINSILEERAQVFLREEGCGMKSSDASASIHNASSVYAAAPPLLSP